MNGVRFLVMAALLSAPAVLAKDPPRSPGKVRAPVEIRFTPLAAVSAGKDVAVRVELVALGRCEAMSSRVHGTKGLRVTAEPELHGSVRAGAAAARVVNVRLAQRRAGHLVVTASCGTGERRREVVKAFELTDPSGVDAARANTVGEVVTDADGTAVRVMPSTPPK